MNLEKLFQQAEEVGMFYTNLLDKVVFAVSDMIIVHTRESKQLMNTFYGVEESKLSIVPHGSYQKPDFKNKDECKADSTYKIEL